jgi:hypothetical protein
VGTVRAGGVTFRLYIELLDDGAVRLSAAHCAAVGGVVKRSEIRKALDAAEGAYDLPLTEWKAMHP